jgi:hypothetical protein
VSAWRLRRDRALMRAATASGMARPTAPIAHRPASDSEAFENTTLELSRPSQRSPPCTGVVGISTEPIARHDQKKKYTIRQGEPAGRAR